MPTDETSKSPEANMQLLLKGCTYLREYDSGNPMLPRSPELYFRIANGLRDVLDTADGLEAMTELAQTDQVAKAFLVDSMWAQRISVNRSLFCPHLDKLLGRVAA